MGSEGLDFGSERPYLRSNRPGFGSEVLDLKSERPDLWPERPDLGSERLDHESEGPDLGSERGLGACLKLGGDVHRKRKKIALGGIMGHLPLRGRCPKKQSAECLLIFPNHTWRELAL